MPYFKRGKKVCFNRNKVAVSLRYTAVISATLSASLSPRNPTGIILRLYICEIKGLIKSSQLTKYLFLSAQVYFFCAIVPSTFTLFFPFSDLHLHDNVNNMFRPLTSCSNFKLIWSMIHANSFRHLVSLVIILVTALKVVRKAWGNCLQCCDGNQPT